MALSISARTRSGLMFRLSRTLLATPSPSRMIPSRMCSVPTALWFRRFASSCARMITRRARSVKRSNIAICCLLSAGYAE